MTKTLRLLALTSIAALGLSTVALAQASKDPAAVQAGTYTLETSHARVVFSVSHMGFSTWYGDFSGATGTLTLDPKALAEAKLDVSIPVASVTTTNAVLDGELKSPAWFDAAQFPTITFHSTKVELTSPTTAKVTGDLTFHGVTKPTTLDVSFKGTGPNPMSKKITLGFDATGALKRSDFGQKTYVPIIGDDVSLQISAPFEKKAN
ncbi:MAG: polyisoprenoid-binding protein [Phenylobacterium zucineum]|nr:MAG: polyisoprenoid-binding protein [Phenylobacterium zucineum]